MLKRIIPGLQFVWGLVGTCSLACLFARAERSVVVERMQHARAKLKAAKKRDFWKLRETRETLGYGPRQNELESKII